MPDYTANDIVDILLVLGECQRNYVQASILYAARFPERRHPNDTVIRNIELRGRQGKFARKRRSILAEDYVNNPQMIAVLAMVHQDPQISLRQIQRELGVPKSTASRYLKKLKYHPYHMSLNQALSVEDYERRLIFCQWVTQQVNNDDNFFKYVMFSDEATFQSTGVLNRHNCHFWSPVNPHWMREVDHQHRWSLNVWCGIVNGYLIGPYFFEGNVDGPTYLHLIRDELPVMLEEVDLNTRNRLWLQQDGASPHWTIIVRNYLNERFNNRWIGRGGPVEWPPRSPDLTSLDFYLWGFLKNEVYRTRPTTKEDMKVRIRNACNAIPRNVLLKTIMHFRKRVNLCIREGGATFEHLLP